MGYKEEKNEEDAEEDIGEAEEVEVEGIVKTMHQVDGGADSSEEDEDNDDADEDDDSDSDLDPDGNSYDGGIEMAPPGSGDDNSEEACDLFDTENVVVCQYDKISRARNKWKLQLKDGVMNLNGRDYVFQKAHGEVDW